jgi:thiol:disulfide interchange protein DsbC
MQKVRLSLLIGFLALSHAGVLMAQGGAAVANAMPPPSAGAELLKRKSVEEVIVSRLQQARPDMKFSSVRPSPIAGLYQVQMVGGPLLYVTAEGDKFIAGDIFTVQASGFAKWEDPALMAERKALLSSINVKDTIPFKAKGKTKAVVYVFTDVDCGYCRKLNSQMTAYTDQGQQKPGYTDLGIEVRYLAYPRAGIPSPSADKLVTAWCSKDKQKTMTMLKADQVVPSVTCDNPVAAQFELGAKVGVNGTPAIWMPSGELMPGYLPPEDLAKRLGIL